jgi:hypothetical protein
MSQQVEIQQLILKHQRRLQKLKEKEATFGVSTPPEILIEIENIESKIKNLQEELKALVQETPNSVSSDTNPKVNEEYLKILINIAEEILVQANNSLIENEKALIPFFQSSSTREQVHADMVQLYHNQRNRGDFGRWKSFLEETLSKVTEDEVRESITSLLTAIYQLYEAFYSDSPYFRTRGGKNMTIEYLSAANAVNDRGLYYSVDYQTALQVARWYLDSLRETVENIGYTIGKLRAKLAN